MQINWEKATRDFGAASVESMRVMTRTALKKIEKAGGKEGVAATPAKAGGSGKKRKGAAEDGDDAEPTPTKKKPGRKAKKEVSPIEGKRFFHGLNEGLCADRTGRW